MFYCHPQFRKRDGHSIKPNVQSYSYSPLQIAQAYGLPIGSLNGSGVTIGIIELGGAFSYADYDKFMASLGIKTYKKPVCIGTQSNDPNGANVEVMLDAEIIGALAPQADIRLYFMPNTGTGMADGINKAVADGCDVISISWGAPEKDWAASDRVLTDKALQNAATKGVAVYVAAGDSGSSDGDSGTNVDYPASSPYSIGCGGTYLAIANGQIKSESVWNDGSAGGATGGGYSAVYAMPAFQSSKVTTGKRGVPDVAGVADPNSGWVVVADGQSAVVGGTSAVAPMWAAIHALLVQKKGVSLSSFVQTLYAHEEVFHDITVGDNGSFKAGVGYDECTGLGTPNGAKLFALNLGTVTPPSPPPPPPPPPAPIPQPPVCWSRMERYLELPNGSLKRIIREFMQSMGEDHA